MNGHLMSKFKNISKNLANKDNKNKKIKTKVKKKGGTKMERKLKSEGPKLKLNNHQIPT